MTQETIPLPGIPVSAGALIYDRAGRLLILKPTYKSGWTIPGGVMEADGESPWEACQREVREETGLEVSRGRLAAMDFRRPREGRPGGIRFLFDCGQVSDKALASLKLQLEEISESRLAPLPDALTLLRGPIRRRVRAATKRRALSTWRTAAQSDPAGPLANDQAEEIAGRRGAGPEARAPRGRGRRAPLRRSTRWQACSSG